MTKQYGPSIYIPTDKNIFDALQHKKITQSILVSFLRKRGIFVSNAASKDELVNYTAALTFDFNDFKEIAKHLENPNRKEKVTRTSIQTTSSTQEVLAACQQVKDKSEDEGDTIKVVKDGDTTKLIVTYTDTDFTKTELRQRTRKTCEVDVMTGDNEVTLRMPANKKAREVALKFKTNLESIKGEVLQEEVVSLENIVKPEARSYFFDMLIKSINGYSFDNVSHVDVFHDPDSSLDEEDDDEADGSSFAGYITKAALAGSGVLESSEFNQLHNRGFYIYRIIWTSIESLTGGDKIELEAQFGSPSSCTDFKYLLRGVFNYNDRNKAHNVTKRTPTPREVNQINELLEKAAKTAYEAVIKKFVESENEKN
ncbi:hypothetical protein C1E23_11635 [Pseudoalteromonas phenolica]|uniref:Uncharacterized protein n=1 Tax=Pseudoalteromonas phenolica TaxID=161398 RepID=A0A4Q7IMA3_9GAMM|nr:hypothetical protein [Pseudoalteromonas phenolica]RZQ52911.1 hypothetical protein C1E23_11635 [Pseudoalteromonas phenolica]